MASIKEIVKADSEIGSAVEHWFSADFIYEVQRAQAWITQALLCDEITQVSRSHSFEITKTAAKAPVAWGDDIYECLTMRDHGSDGIEVEYILPGFKTRWMTTDTSKADMDAASKIWKNALGALPNRNDKSGFKHSFDLFSVRRLFPEFRMPGDATAAQKPIAVSDPLFAKYAKFVWFDLKVEPPESSEDDGYITFGMFMRALVPKEFANWTCCARSDDEFSHHEFITALNEGIAFHLMSSDPKKKKRKTPPSRQRGSLMSFISRTVDYYAMGKDAPVAPRVNEDSLTILGDGSITYIPEAVQGGVKMYAKEERSLWDQTTGQLFRHAKDSPVINKVIHIDWRAGAMLISNAEGKINHIDLYGSRVPDEATLGFFLQKERGLDEWTKLAGVVAHYADGPLYAPDPFGGGRRPFTQAIRQLLTKHEKLPYAAGAEPTIVDNRGNEDNSAKATAAAFIQIMADAAKDWPKRDDIPISVKIEHLGIITVIGKHATDEFYRKASLEAHQHNTMRPARNEHPEIYGLPGVTGLMPHQYTTINELNQGFDNVMIGVSPGGGKTIIQSADITKALVDDRVKRPAVLMPGPIISQFSNEVSKFSRGNLRPFVIDTLAWLAFTRAGMGPDEIAEVVKSQPPNTVLLISYSVMYKFGATIKIGPSNIDAYPFVKWLQSCGVDGVYCDESHKAKNTKAGIAYIVRELAAFAKVVRMASGTILYNTPTDIVGQMAVINPSAIDLQEMNDAIDKKTGHIEEKKIPEIDKAVKTFARKININSSEWAFILPKMDQRFTLVTMTPAQRAFYNNKIIQPITDEMLRNKALMKAIESGDAAAQGRIESAFRRYLAKADVFVAAPDATEPFGYGDVFKVEEGVTEKDLVSGKMAALDNILQAHFHGGDIEYWSGSRGVYKEKSAASPNKVIVVAWNKPIGGRIMAHSRFSDLMIRYTAGDADALAEFAKDDSKYKILVADATAIQEGINLQMADRVIAMQTPWTSGAWRQVLSRAFRPDFNNKYNRKSVAINILITDNTTDIAKAARLMWKEIENARIEEKDNKQFIDWFIQNADRVVSTKKLSTNLDVVSNHDSVTKVAEHFQLYESFVDVRQREFTVKFLALKQMIEKKIGRTITDEEVRSLAVSEPTHKELKLPGMEVGSVFGSFTSQARGAPPFDPFNLNLTCLVESVKESDEEDDEEEDDDGGEVVDVVKIKEGDVVITPFGMAVVKRVSSQVLTVVVPGFNKGAPFLVTKKMSYVPKDDNDRKALALLLATEKAIPFIGANRKTITAKHIEQARARVLKGAKEKIEDIKPKKGKVVEPEEEEEEDIAPAKTGKSGKTGKTTKPAKPASDILIQSLEMYNDPGIMVFNQDLDDDQREHLQENGWREIGASAYIQANTSKGLKDFIVWMTENYDVQPKYLAKLNDIYNLFRAGRGSLSKFLKPNTTAMKNLLQDNTKPTEKGELRPIPVIEADQLFIYFNGKVSAAARTLPGKRPVTGMSAFKKSEAFWVFLAPNAATVRKQAKSLEALGWNLKGLKKTLSELE